ncbi:MAG TPA: hypothetical protein VLQ48_01380 [Chloroflexia bacterium]|nr:hypothetical protein [Chloroflexia bacterium]
MWNKTLAQCARVYPTGVLTLIDDAGFPFSVRCEASFDDTTETITLHELPANLAGYQSKACMLFHRHKADFSDQHELMIKGELTWEGKEAYIHPDGWLTGTGNSVDDRMPVSGSLLDRIRFMRTGRRRAGEYLQKRGGEPWPPRPWAKMLAYLEKDDKT